MTRRASRVGTLLTGMVAVAGLLIVPTTTAASAAPTEATKAPAAEQHEVLRLLREQADREAQRAAEKAEHDAPVSAAAVTVYGVQPNQLRQGADEQVRVHGGDLSPMAVGSISGTGVTVTKSYVTAWGSLTLDVIVAPDAAVGPRDVTVVDGDSSATCTGCFRVSNEVSLEYSHPSSVPPGLTGFEISFYGANFEHGAQLTVAGGGVTVKSVVRRTSGELDAILDVAGDAALGSREVTVTNPDGGTATCGFCLNIDGTPYAWGVSPHRVAPGLTAERLVIYGGNVQVGAVLSVSGTNLFTGPTVVMSGGEVSRMLAVPADAAAGMRDVIITNPDGTSDTCTSCLEINPLPYVDYASGARPGTQTKMFIDGSGFLVGSQVTVSGTGVSVGLPRRVSSTDLEAAVTVAPDAATGLRDVTVKTANGSMTCSGCMRIANSTVQTGLSKHSIHPRRIAPGSDSPVMIYIAGKEGDKLSIPGGGVTVTSTTVHPHRLENQVTVAADAPEGVRDVVLNRADGTTLTCTACFVVHKVMGIHGVSPETLIPGETTEVYVHGGSFREGATVSVSGSGVTAGTPQRLDAGAYLVPLTVAANATGEMRRLVITGPDGQKAYCDCVRVTTLPDVEYVFTDALATPGTYHATVIGSGFAEGATVTVGGTGVSAVVTEQYGKQQLAVELTVAEGAAAGARSLTVNNPSGTSASCSALQQWGCLSLHPDSDGDTVGDTFDICALAADPAQVDSDGDGPGDVCDDISDVHNAAFAYAYVKALVNAGVTAGCNAAGEPVRYCPTGDVTRRQMAIFLLRAAKISQDGSNLAPYEGIFADVPNSYSARFIEELKRLDVTGGCSTDAATGKPNYCPEPVPGSGELGLVTRQQMALFLLRTAKVSQDGSNLPAYEGTFGDVPDSYSAEFIEELARRGITGGCTSGSADVKPNYCPGAKVNRQAMAIFLVRTFNLPLP